MGLTCEPLTPEDLRIIKEFKKNNPAICYYCGKSVHGKDKTIDHKLPRCRNGKTWYSNLCIACADCNVEKDNMTDTEYKEYLLSGRNPELLKKIKQRIKLEKQQKLSKERILQEHIIMEARNDSRVRSYIRTNSYLLHMDSLFKQIEAM